MTFTHEQTQKKNLTYLLSSHEKQNQELSEDLIQCSCSIYYTRNKHLKHFVKLLKLFSSQKRHTEISVINQGSLKRTSVFTKL